MEKMQRSALSAGGQGVVEVEVTDEADEFARPRAVVHSLGDEPFVCWPVRASSSSRASSPLDDAVVTFEAESLRGGRDRSAPVDAEQDLDAFDRPSSR